MHFRKYVKFAHRENKKVSRLSILGDLIRQIFDDSGVFAPNSLIIQMNAFLFSV